MEFFWQSLCCHGAAAAVIAGDEVLSFADVARHADQLAEATRQMLPAAISRPLVAIEASNHPNAIIAYFGALRANWPIILLPIGGAGNDSEIVARYQPNVIFRGLAAGSVAYVTDAAPCAMADDLAVMLSTSGTTGSPKLVCLSRENIQSNSIAIADYLQLTPRDRAMTTLPFNYSYGMSVIHSYFAAGAGIILSDHSVVEPQFWEVARSANCTSLALVPTQFVLLEKAGFEEQWLPTLRYITQAGGKLDADTARRFAQRAADCQWDMYFMYGQTEASPRMAFVPPKDALTHFHAIGQPIGGGRFTLINASGDEINEPGVSGELIYEGANVMLGYAIDRGALNNLVRPERLHTGDIAECLVNGYYVITGRMSRFVKLFGLRIGLDEIERIFSTRGQRVYVVGTDDRLTVFMDGNDQERNESESFLSNRLNLPRSAISSEPLHKVPTLNNGKVDYSALERLASEFDRKVKSGREGIHSVFETIFKGLPVDYHLSFSELGADSLSYLEVELYFSDRSNNLPQGWENLPLIDIVKIDTSAVKDEAKFTRLPVDLLFRLLALAMVVTLHATTLPTGGGAYVLMMFAGVSLARFQIESLLQMRVWHSIKTMLVPISVCYFGILTLLQIFQGPIDWRWFLLAGNFVNEIRPRGLEPYWFVCAYAQTIILMSVPFLVPPVARFTERHRWLSGMCAWGIAAMLFLILDLEKIAPDIRHRHPVAALNLALAGWCLIVPGTHRQRLVTLTALTAMLILGWGDIGIVGQMLLLGAAVAILWNVQIWFPSRLTRAFLGLAGLSMFIYLGHSPAISLASKFVPDQNIVQLMFVMPITIVLAIFMRMAYRQGGQTLRYILSNAMHGARDRKS